MLKTVPIAIVAAYAAGAFARIGMAVAQGWDGVSNVTQLLATALAASLVWPLDVWNYFF